MIRNRMKRFGWGSIAVALASCSTTNTQRAGTAPTLSQGQELPIHPSTPALVAARVAGMHMAATLLFRGIKATISSGGDVRQQVHQAEGLALWGHAIPGLFPLGSGHPDSSAKPEIWRDFPDFRARAATLEAAATKLAETAAKGDQAGFSANAKLVESACSSCHEAYRAQ